MAITKKTSYNKVKKVTKRKSPAKKRVNKRKSPAAKKVTKRKSPAKKRVTKKKSAEKAPAGTPKQSAQNLPEGTKRQGRNGHMYKAVSNASGSKLIWRKCNGKSVVCPSHSVQGPQRM